MAWVADFFRKVIEVQSKVLYEFPEAERQKGYGHAAKVIVDGPDGQEQFDLWFTERGVEPKPDNVEIRNELHTTEDVLLDIITPDITLDELLALIEKQGSVDKAIAKLRPRLHPRTAIANRLTSMGGENPDIDSEIWSQIWEKFVYGIAFPIVVGGILRQAKTKARR